MTTRLTNLVDRLAAHTWLVVAGVLAVTAALVVPFLTMAPTTSASTEPSGDVFEARDRIDETFVSSVHPTFIIVEHRSGQVLTVEALGSLLAAEDDLRSDPELGSTLFRYFDVEAGVDVNGIVTLADLVDGKLREQGVDGIAAATDEQVKQVGSAIIDRLGERSDVLAISSQSVRSDDGWTVPALSILVLSDNDALGFGNTSVNLGGDTDIEEFDRDVQEVFRVDGWQANGVAIDVNLTSQEQGAVAGPFIGFTILAVLLLVGLTFRSYWVLATVSVAFLILIVWLKGISNLIGLKDDLVLSLIVPVAMISFGVDFAFHAIGRYREERTEGRAAAVAIVTGLTAVSGALLLALLSDTGAFLANLTSGIESINQFGIGAAIALGSAYLLLGVVCPLVVARIEADVPAAAGGKRSAVGRIGGSLLAASLSMASVLLLVFILPWLGVVLAVITVLSILVVPYLVRRRRPGPRVGEQSVTVADNRLATPVGRVVTTLASRPWLVLPAALVISGLAAVFAIRVPAEFDVEDFFSGDTDFVVGLDQLDTHVGDRGGEPAQIYVEGDLTDPANLALLADRVDQIAELDTPSLARDGEGRVEVFTGVLDVLDKSLSSPAMIGLVEQQTGMMVTDDNGDRIPDTRDQVEAVLAVASTVGVPLDQERLLVNPDDVNTVFASGGEAEGSAADSPDRTVFSMGVVDSRAQESVTATKEALEPITEAMSEDLGGTFVQVTGSALVREASLDGTNRALQLSLPVAVVLCLTIAGLFLRSLRYGLAAIMPILMVVAWLYGFMYVAGFAINLVTATIAAVSIGIGIDFAIHFIARYREELHRTGRRTEAVRIAGEGTGLALVASAVSSAVGFGILALAPMPLFAAYGLLTALMIMMALVATLAVLPAILVLITRDEPPTSQPAPGRPDRRRTVDVDDVDDVDDGEAMIITGSG
ncbi:MAG: efflux RND transporter permease subunit [Acidimicrobiia bacterium]|nr:efflux RND transporter permease subunit [Acidimicrobiia bacterium]